MDNSRKIVGLDKMEPDRETQNKYVENKIETLILKPTREPEGIYSLTEEERRKYLSITEQNLIDLKIKAPFIEVWKATVDRIRELETKNNSKVQNERDEDNER